MIYTVYSHPLFQSVPLSVSRILQRPLWYRPARRTMLIPTRESSMPEAPHPIPEPFPIPFVSSISPDSGPAGGGTEVRIEGTFPGIVSMVRFGAVEAPGFICEKVNSTIITVKSPPGIPGTVDVTVTTQGGTESCNANRPVYVYPPSTGYNQSPKWGG